MSVFAVGSTVFVEAVVVAHAPGQPFGAVHVRVPGSTDPDHLLDGVEAIVPEPLAVPSAEVYFHGSADSIESDQFTDPDGWPYGEHYEGETPWA